MRVVATAISGTTEVVEAIDQAVAAAVDPLSGVTGTVVEIGTDYGIARGLTIVTVTVTATETEIMTIIALGAVGLLAHLYADVRAAALARVLEAVNVLDHVLVLLDGDLGLGAARLRLL